MPKGFSLIEVLVAIAILGLSAAIAVPNLSRFNADEQVSSTRAQMLSDLNLVKSNAQSGVRCPTGLESSSWNLQFASANTYDLNSVCNDNSTPEEVNFRAYAFPENITVSQIMSDVAGCEISSQSLIEDFKVDFSASPTNINFIHPTVTCFESRDAASFVNLIKITLQKNSITKTLVVTRGGAIYAE